MGLFESSLRSHPVLIFLAVVGVLIVFSAITGWARKKERSRVLQSMGFIEVQREQVFESPKLITTFMNEGITSIQTPVGKGSTAVRETVIADIRQFIDSEDQRLSTAVIFRVRPELPDFQIRHRFWLDKLVPHKSTSSAGTP